MQAKANLDTSRVRVAEAGGQELLERLEHLDARRSTGPARLDLPRAPDPQASADYDIAFAGGGLSLLIAATLAQRGLRVAVFERSTAGEGHREWNASRSELDALVDVGLFSAAEIDELCITHYDHGICRWHGGSAYPVTGVLDTPVDAGALLRATRTKASDAGVGFFDNHSLVGHAEGRSLVNLRFRHGGNRSEATTRILVDARGTSSPYANADLLCPTVGGVVSGLDQGDDLDQINPRVGEILATIDDVQWGRQHIWEAFPGRPNETTVYLFYYAPEQDVASGSLVALFDRFFRTLPDYKRGEARLLRPTFGLIPGWSRLTPAPRPPGARLALVGDAAARHSPLTYCGFGAMLRSVAPATRALQRAASLSHVPMGTLDHIVDDAPVHAGTGLLAWMMANPDQRPGHAHQLNRLLDTAFATIHELGDESYRALLRDELPMKDFAWFLHRTSLKRPRVYRDVFTRLGPRFVGRWGWLIAKEIVRA